MESILITGASGFIGSFIVQEALKRRFGVWAGIRASSSKKYLKERKIHFLELDFAHPNELRAQLSGFFNTKVQLTCSEKGKGKISIPFGNEEELERIMEIFDTLKK